MDGIRVHEGDLEPEEALARGRVDQVGAGTRELRECRVQIVYLIRHVVHAGAALREKAADRGVLAERLEQLDAAVTDPQGSRTHALVVDGRTMLDVCAEQPRIRLQRLVEVLDGDAKVVDPARGHAGEANGTR